LCRWKHIFAAENIFVQVGTYLCIQENICADRKIFVQMGKYSCRWESIRADGKLFVEMWELCAGLENYFRSEMFMQCKNYLC
jgi:hypothetical protein